MNINFTGHGVEINPYLQEYVEKKFSRLDHRGDQITRVKIILNVNKLDQIAEATIHVAGRDIHASSKSNDMYASIDELVDILERQIIKHKEKIKDHHKKDK